MPEMTISTDNVDAEIVEKPKDGILNLLEGS